jgi:hypothetical protein
LPLLRAGERSGLPMLEFDAVVAGAGPDGSTAAPVMAAAGSPRAPGRKKGPDRLPRPVRRVRGRL